MQKPLSPEKITEMTGISQEKSQEWLSGSMLKSFNTPSGKLIVEWEVLATFLKNQGIESNALPGAVW